MNPVPRGLIAADLLQALSLEGCPICYTRSESEHRYMHSLLWEHVNDDATRNHLRASLGCCGRHTWQIGRMEVDGFGSALGNGIIYQDLLGQVRSRLDEHRRRAGGYGQRPTRAPIRSRRRWPWESPESLLGPLDPCLICTVGERAERSMLAWLVQGLSDEPSPFRVAYGHQGKLCLRHLNHALTLDAARGAPGQQFLAEQARQDLERLSADLDGFIAKHAWERRDDPMSVSEKSAWNAALAFFGGNEPGSGPGGHE